jgi:hypothetical protein
MVTAQQAVMNSLFTAFAGFTAFGAAIVAVLAGGGAVQSIADRWVKHAQQEHPEDRHAWLRNPAVVIPSACLICLVVLGSGTGLVLSFLWLHTTGSDGWGWTFGVSEALFWCEVIGITVLTAAAVAAAGWASATAKSDKANQGQREDGAGMIIRLHSGGDTLELTGVSPAEQRRLTDEWLNRHPASAKPADQITGGATAAEHGG